MNKEFRDWCSKIRSIWEETFHQKPKAPNMVNLESSIQERIMRCALEVRAFNLDPDDRDTLVVLAHHTLLLDDIKSKTNDRHERLYGSQINA